MILRCTCPRPSHVQLDSVARCEYISFAIFSFSKLLICNHTLIVRPTLWWPPPLLVILIYYFQLRKIIVDRYLVSLLPLSTLLSISTSTCTVQTVSRVASACNTYFLTRCLLTYGCQTSCILQVALPANGSASRAYLSEHNLRNSACLGLNLRTQALRLVKPVF